MPEPCICGGAQRIAELVRLRNDTNDAIALAAKNKSISGAVNWGDLHCVDAAYVVSCDGTQDYLVEIEEAAPDAIAFQEFILEALRLRGWTNVRVHTEW